MLLISGSEMHLDRTAQHKAVLGAAVKAGVALFAYPSAPGSQTDTVTDDHRAPEDAILASGIPYSLLRNNIYHEMVTMNIPTALELGALVRTAGKGRLASASRADYAATAAAVLSGDDHEDTVYELSGNTAWSFAEFAAELSKQSGRHVPYHAVTGEEYAAMLSGAGLPDPLLHIMAASTPPSPPGSSPSPLATCPAWPAGPPPRSRTRSPSPIAPFELFPDAGPEPFDSFEYVLHKFGGDQAQAARIEEHMAALARAQGQPYSIQHPVASTFDAHRMLHLAAEYGAASEFMDAVQRDLLGEGWPSSHGNASFRPLHANDRHQPSARPETGETRRRRTRLPGVARRPRSYQASQTVAWATRSTNAQALRTQACSPSTRS